MMADVQFNEAVRKLCGLYLPEGFDWAPDAPDTFEDLKAMWDTTGRMVVTDRFVAEDHPAFEDAYTYRAFRAWHDYIHLAHNCPFNLPGECRAADIQRRQLAAAYGDDNARRWLSVLDDELIINNFGNCAECEVRP